MSIYLALPLIAMVSNLGLAFMTMRGQWQATGQRAFAFFLVAMASWGGLLFMMRSSSNLADAYFWDKLVVADVALISVFYLHFTFGFSNAPSAKWLIRAAYSLFGVLAITTAMGLTVAGMQVKSYGYAPIWGPAFAVFFVVVYGAIMLGATNMYSTARRGASPALRNRAGYVLLGTMISLIGGITDILPSVGVPIYPLGIVGNIVFATLATIAMVKVRLLDIRLALRRTFAYTMVGLVVLGAYFGFSGLLGAAFGVAAARGTVAFTIFFVAVCVVAIPKLNDRIQRLVDKTFFGDRYSALKSLERFSEQVKDVTDRKALSESLVRLLMGATGAKFAALMEPDQERASFITTAAAGTDVAFELPYGGGASALARLETHAKVQSADELSLFPEWEMVTAAERTKLTASQAHLFVPVLSQSVLIAVLVLGRREGRGYVQEELDLLRAVANQAATAMENTRLYHELAGQLQANECRVAAFEHAAGRIALEQNPDLAIEQLVGEVMALLDARYGAVAVCPPNGDLTRVIGPGLRRGTRGGAGARRWIDELLTRVGMAPSTAENEYGTDQDLSSEGIAVPFKCKDSGRGVFYLRDKSDGGAFADADIRLVNLFAALIGVLINNVEVFQSEARERSTLTAIQASMTEGLVVLDPEGEILYFNDAAERHWSITASTVMGRSFIEAIADHAQDFEDPEGAMASIAMLFGPEVELPVIEISVARPDRRELAMSTFPITTPDGADMVGLLVRDITEEKELERRRDTFVSVASHELRTPMTTILGFTELLLDDIPEGDNRRWLEHVHEDSLRLTSILDDMLDVSRIQSGIVKMTIERVDLDHVITSVVGGIGSTTDIHQIEIDIAPGLPKALTDEGKTTQVVLNLVSNAIKYSPAGGTIHISAEPSEDGHDVVVKVSDQGIGIAPEDIDRVFDTFYCVKNEETYEIRGTGLGLYIVRSIVEGIGGTMGVESEVGKGSTFYFTMPTALIGTTQPKREQYEQSLIG
jgi:PAS domain S-box-containing protein